MIELLAIYLGLYAVVGLGLLLFGRKGSGLIWSRNTLYVGFCWNPLTKDFFIFPLPKLGIVIRFG